MNHPQLLLVRALFFATVVLLSATQVGADIQDLHELLPPTDTVIKYQTGYIRGPGYIDIGKLTFATISVPFLNDNDDGMYDENYDSEFNDPADEDGGNRRLDGGIEMGATAIDLVVLRKPDNCAKSRKGCDWPELGIGVRGQKGMFEYCCSEATIAAGLCEEEFRGRLIIDQDKFHGYHRFVSVPPEGDMSKSVRYGHLEQTDTGLYVFVLANCNVQEGRSILVTGETVWYSKHGYLPGELYGYMHFYLVLTIVYLLLMTWYLLLMKKNSDSRIPIEKWILVPIILGSIEMFFRTADCYLWNMSGRRIAFVVYLRILFGVCKNSIAWCLLIMLSLGWGVVRDSLGSTLRTIIILGGVYTGLCVICEVIQEFWNNEFEELTVDEDAEILDILFVLTLVISAFQVVFFLWILDGLNSTMQYLENMNQTRKLQRFLHLRSLLLYALLLATMWVVFALVDSYDENGIVMEENEWMLESATEMIFLFVLIGIAYMWRPNPTAKEYAYAMELPALGDGETELELTDVVPSAMDDDDEGAAGNGANGFHDSDNGHDTRFQID